MPKFYLDTEEKGKGYIVGWMGRLQKTRDGQNNRKGGSATPPVEGDDFSFTASGAVVEPSILQVQKPNDRLGDFTVVRASDASYTDSSGVIQTAPDNIARIDYTNGVAELLTEPQSTNLITQSIDFSSPWLRANCTVNPDVELSPDGTSDTSHIALIASDGAALKFNDTSASGVHTMSIWVKRVELSNDDDFRMAYYNVTDDLVYSPTFTAIDEWQRFEWTPSPTVGNNQWWFINNPTGVERDFLIWGAQLEELPYATSYIPTNGSTVTRLQDVITDGGNVNVINSEEGVLFFEGSALFDDATWRYITASDGSSDNRVIFAFNTGDDIYGSVRVGGVNVINSVTGTTDSRDNAKVAIKWKLNDFAVWVNGTEALSETSGSSFLYNTLDRVHLANDTTTSNFFGRTRELKCYDRALTDEELQSITEL